MSGTFKQFLIPLLTGFALMLLVHGQVQTGFISIDCGLQENSSYSEPTTTINYISDETFIDTGERKLVSPENRNNLQQPYWSLRSFPHGTRNCYKINVKSATKYLIRASFLHGNYDGENKPKFELHLGPNLWDSVSIENASTITNKELIHLVPVDRNYLHVCLVETSSGVPFISAIELRPLPNKTYQTQMGSLELYSRLDTGQVRPERNRYPRDIHDRFWSSDNRHDWTQLSTSSTIDLMINDQNYYQPASIVMSTAATPIFGTDLTFYWEPEDENAEYYIYMHFAEVEELPADQTRQLVVTRNGQLFGEPFTVDYLYTTTVYSQYAMSGGQYNFSIGNADANSDLPPILNAIEIYRVKEFPEQETNQDDVNAITNIKLTYKIEKNWQGDPCSPKNYSWEGLNCSDSPNDSPRIISLDLSSSGLIGEIDASISDPTRIQTLDLSNNNLTGPIPDFLSQMSNLNVLNLENNKLTGSIPNGLVERRKNGLLSLSG